MNIYFLTYIFVIIYSIFIGYKIYKIYLNKSGFFFLLFTIFLSLWYLLYFIFFLGIENPTLLLYISRIDFSLGLIGVYSLLLFVIFYKTGTTNISKDKKQVSFILFSFSLLVLYFTFSDDIIKGLTYSNSSLVYREVYGEKYWIVILGYLIFIILFIYNSYKQVKKQIYINKLRFKSFLTGAIICLVLLLFFQLILPLFNVWILEKEIIFLFLFFVIYSLYSLKKYYRNTSSYNAGKIMVLTFSIAFSISFHLLIKVLYFEFKGEIYTQVFDNLGYSYWLDNSAYSYGAFDIFAGILLFILFNKFFSKLFLGNTVETELRNYINKLEQNISYITNLTELNVYLKIEMQKIFKTDFCEIIIFNKNNKKLEIQKYFESIVTEKVFINDIVFIEENKSKFNKDKIILELPKESFIIFPLYKGDGENIGIFSLGTKLFGDFYNIDEINAIQRFIFFLEYHIKYIKTYEQIKDLSVNLDKKVDEKTIEYNNLINKQKEFIGMISHEIRSPISGAIFQADSIIDDLESGECDNKKISEELEILNSLLIKTGELTSKLFSVQYYDTHSITLYKEKVQIANLLETEFDVYSHMNEKIKFINRIDSKMGFVEIDKIQFQQVITNVITNAIKFVNSKNGIIIFEANIKSGFLNVTIEDNGKGFDGIEISNLFEKYSTGSGSSIGLGMGLYLCKKIIEMHHGEIHASISKELGGAKFDIKIPI